MEWMAHCGCRLEIRPEDGEPIAFNFRCPIHQTATPEVVSGENRAMSLARKAVSEALDLPIEEVPPAELQGDDRHAHCEYQGAVIDIASKGMSLAEYLRQHPDVRTFVKRA